MSGTMLRLSRVVFRESVGVMGRVAGGIREERREETVLIDPRPVNSRQADVEIYWDAGLVEVRSRDSDASVLVPAHNVREMHRMRANAKPKVA